MPRRAPWSIEHDVREDAESIFLPVGDVAGAQVGDAVIMTSGDGGAVHRGRVTERVTDETRGEFYIVRVDPPS